VGVGDHDWAFQEAGIFDPCGTSHFTVSVEREPAGEYRVERILATGKNGSHAGAHGTDADFQSAAA